MARNSVLKRSATCVLFAQIARISEPDVSRPGQVRRLPGHGPSVAIGLEPSRIPRRSTTSYDLLPRPVPCGSTHASSPIAVTLLRRRPARSPGSRFPGPLTAIPIPTRQRTTLRCASSPPTAATSGFPAPWRKRSRCSEPASAICRSPGNATCRRARSKTTSARSWKSSAPLWRPATKASPGCPATWASGQVTSSTIGQDTG